MKLCEFQTTAKDRLLLFGRKWIPEQNAKGVICLVHGLGEHSGRYEHVAAALTKEGYAVTVLTRGVTVNHKGGGEIFHPMRQPLMTLVTCWRKQARSLLAVLYFFTVTVWAATWY